FDPAAAMVADGATALHDDIGGAAADGAADEEVLGALGGGRLREQEKGEENRGWHGGGSDQPALLHRSLDEAGEERVRVEGLGLQLRMELHADEPGMIR